MCAQALKDGSLQPRTLQGLGTLVLDEADLLLSFGYEDDLRQLQPLVRLNTSHQIQICRSASLKSADLV